MSSEFSRKELKKPDVVLTRLRSGYEWVDSHMHIVALLAVVIFIGAAIWARVDYFSQVQEEKALSSYYKAEKNLDKKKADLELKKNTDKKPVDILSQLNTEIAELKGATQKYPKSKAALLEELKLGDLYFHEKKYTEAISFYQNAFKMSPNTFYKILCLYNLGYLYELSLDYPKAIEWYSKITAYKKQRILLLSIEFNQYIWWLEKK